ncbi:MAG: helix-turn-helix domain-containing protein [Oscillospiraceae bacterium]|nr:helix-turn-helix domain-containing protein [Oscillospiraceae bacterium]
MTNKQNFAAFIKEKRSTLSLTQEQLADRLGVLPTTVSKWERGITYPDITIISDICKALDISEHELMTASNEAFLTHFDSKFSLRTQGVLVRDGCVLLQSDTREEYAGNFATPGGQVRFGETAAQALTRRFKQETGFDITVGELAWTEENFYTWEGKAIQQVALTFHLRIRDALPQQDFAGAADAPHLRFHWVPLDQLDNTTVYPENLRELLQNATTHVVRISTPTPAYT